MSENKVELSEFENIKFDGLQDSKKKGVVDIIFLIDTTGSMGPSIANIAKNIATFISNIDSNIVKDWKVKVVSFGDLDVDRAEVALKTDRPWTNDHQEIVNQLAECINTVKEGGGGDEPESSLDALYTVVTSNLFNGSWSERTRALVVFTDASAKPIKKETIGMELSEEESLQVLAQKINENHVYLHMFAPKNSHYETISHLASKYTTYYPLDETNPVEALKNLDFTKVLETLGKSVSQESLIE